MIIRLFILFAVVPVIELYLLLKIGSYIGPLRTVIITLCISGIGAYLAKSQGFKVIGKINQALREGLPPTREILNGLFILIGGLLLLTPGFLTDFIGLTMLIPPVRALYSKAAANFIQKKFNTGEWDSTFF